MLFWYLLLGLLPFQKNPLERFPAERCSLIDVDGDGWLDLCLSSGIFLNQQGQGWQAGGPKLPPGTSFLVWADFDQDGRLEGLAVKRQTPAEFVEQPRAHHLLGMENPEFESSSHWNTLAVAIADLDRDGRLDLAFGQAYVDESKDYQAQQMRVFSGLGDGHFEDRTEQWGFLTPGPPGAANGGRPLYGLSAADLDGDGYPELMGAAYGRQWNTLWKRGAQTLYSECAAKYGLDGDSIRHGQYSQATREKFRKRNEPRPDELPFRSNGNTFCLAPADFDNDGDLDVFSADITHSWAGDSSDLSALLVNRLEKFGEPFFERCLEVLPQPDPETGFQARPSRGLARDHAPQSPGNWNQGDLQAHWADLDCDGLLDLLICESDYPGNHLRVFLQLPDHSFREAERELGLDFRNCPGLAIGDVDRDGDLDLVTLGTRTRWPEARPAPELVFWRNPSQAPSLNLLLVGDGVTANRDAIGARVYLETDQGTQMRELQGSYGHWGQQTQPGEVHFGLGQAQARRLRVVWPDQKRSETLIEAPRAGWMVIEQGRGERARMHTWNPRVWVEQR